MKDNKNMDELFREKLGNYEQEPPMHLLENILAGVAGERRKRKIVFWRVAGVAAALLLAFVAGWQVNYVNHETMKQPIVASRNLSTEPQKATSVAPETKTVSGKIQETQVAANKPSGKIESSKHLPDVVRIDLQEKIALSEKVGNTQIDESPLLHPLKALSRLLSHNDQFASELHKLEVNKSKSDLKGQSIDQQIIEQNKEKLLAQNEFRKKAQWAVGAQVSPSYSVNRSSHSSQYASNMINYSSNSPVDLGGGVSVEYKPGKRWSLQSGVYYSGLAQTSGNNSRSKAGDYMGVAPGSSNSNTPVNIVASKMSMNSNAGVVELKSVPSGIVLNTNLEDKTMTSSVVASNVQFTQNFEYLEIPLYLRYTVIDSRFDVELLGGLSSNVLVGNGAYVDGSSGKTLVGTTKDMQWLNYSGTFGLGLKYGLSRHIFLNVEPRLKYYLNSLNNNAEVSYKPYTIGVYTGISYQF
jgi:hypothetical protein